ncbi:odorant receptor 4-like [Camponotus floridanus]|uniref:odorant receptor 4-like n=1 Tax=Camponotus floridanus TaxID=104421 RepID=UPI000DC6BE65|nr:odorant receptor 4-like [Camponotus floridanus]
MLSVISLSLNIFAIFYNASLGNKEAFLLHLLIVIIILLVMFLANYTGQEITNYSNHIYSTAYNIRWYKAPSYVQKMILFILQRGNKTFNINITGLFVLSIECFAMLIKASMSYFTVMYSTQQSNEDISYNRS